MSRPRRTVPPPPRPPADPEARAIIARAQRVAACTREVFAAIEPIHERHGCRLSTVQEIKDGQAGPLQIVVVAAE